MRNDIAELTSLNRDYVNSVQNSDVKRFEEILAEDFYCSNPDKSLVDRAGFLKQTAVPVTIRNLTAHDVKIRVLGDFAIIHAATSYTTADGQQAHGQCEPVARRERDECPQMRALMSLRRVLELRRVHPGSHGCLDGFGNE